MIFYQIGPLQLAILVVQNRHAGTQKSHLKLCAFCFSVPSATFASQHGGFVPREWQAVKGLPLKFIKEMYGDQSGKLILGLKGLVEGNDKRRLQNI